jgi:NitT/TauT family transport system ATP-binding protein
VEGISQEYRIAGRQLPALADVSFEVAQGEILSLLGPSGCGKSTLLRLVAGLLPPTRGAVRLRDQQVLEPQCDLGFVFQFPTLLPWRTVERNVLLPAEVNRGVAPPDIREKARRMLAELGLAGFENSYPHNLSGGMQQRVALARAILLEPPLLLLDEPFGALDEPTRRELGSLLVATVNRYRLTCLFVSHDVEEAVFVAHRVLVLSNRPGRIVREVKVPLAQPRTLATLSDETFLRLVAETTRIVFAGTLQGG